MNPAKDSLPPMEYLSLPHTRASSHRLVPEVDDTLLTNLRNPIMTLIEDTSPGAHDTLTAACDASQYAALGVDKPAEHGSCAENLVLALKELNEKAGLKGTKAVGADITVNIAPTPLHLFMNAPIEVDMSAKDSGAGAKGAMLKVNEPQGKKRSYVRFRAERDMVVVLSACPMDVGSQNGGKCMAANFMVEDVEEGGEEGEALKKAASGSGTKKAPKKLNSGGKKKPDEDATKESEKKEADKPNEAVEKKGPPANIRGGPKKISAVKASAQRQDSSSDPPESELPEEAKKETQSETKQEDVPKKKAPKKLAPKTEAKEAPKEEPKEQPSTQDEATDDAPKPKKKPKKLQRRGTTPAQSEEA
jgi:uncharacterized protein YcgI (DUF1989 family)